MNRIAGFSINSGGERMSGQKDAQPEVVNQNPPSKDAQKQAPDAQIVEKGNGEAGTSNDRYLISKEEFQKYIEIDLWTKFRARLWGMVAIVLTLITIAGYFGVAYFINTSIANRLTEMEKDFALKRTEILQRGRVLNTLVATDQAQRAQLLRDIYFLSGRMQDTQLNQQTSPGLDEITVLKTDLEALASIEDFSNIQTGSLLRKLKASPELAKRSIMPPKMIRSEDPNNVSHQIHPICNGTLQGVIDDIRYRVVSLAAFERSIKEFGMQFNYDYTTGPVREKSVRELYEESFYKPYREHLDQLANQFLGSEEVPRFKQYKPLYFIRDISISQTGVNPKSETTS
jgi:hypothetical protein